MTESDSGTGLRRLLAWPRPYELLQVAVGSHVSHRTFVRDHVRPSAGSRLLDIGCGPGHILRALPSQVAYVGLDRSPEYIAAARRDWGERGDFVCAPVEDASLDGRRFDIVMAMGLLHHLDDSESASVFALANAVLAPGGRFVAVDPAYVIGQPRSARWLISRDRGAYVREPEAYAGLARPWFGSVQVTVRSDLLRVPYTHAVLAAA
jgi:SAM-dependent methyltransferase